MKERSQKPKKEEKMEERASLYSNVCFSKGNRNNGYIELTSHGDAPMCFFLFSSKTRDFFFRSTLKRFKFCTPVVQAFFTNNHMDLKFISDK